jgi:hypothetical protein
MRDAQKARGNLGLRLSIQGSVGVHSGHDRLIDATRQAIQRLADGLGDILATQENGVVRWKESSIVLECRQVVVHDLGVGRVQIGHIQRSGSDAAIGEIVRQPAHVRLRQPIVRTNAGPPVGALHELVAETETKRRMFGELGHSSDAKFRRPIASHAQDVGVVETERIGRPYGFASQHIAQIGIAVDILTGEYLGP